MENGFRRLARAVDARRSRTRRGLDGPLTETLGERQTQAERSSVPGTAHVSRRVSLGIGGAAAVGLALGPLAGRAAAAGGDLTATANPSAAGQLPVSVNTSTCQVSWVGAAINVMAYGAVGNGSTDDTSAVQSAINAASQLAASSGIVDVVLPSGYEFLLGQLALKSGVRLWAYGALIKPALSEINQAWLYYSGGGSLSHFEIRGGTWQGTGTEGNGSNTQLLFEVASGQGCNDVVFRDMTITNWGSGVLYIRNPERARVLENTVQNVGAASSQLYNAINFVVDGTMSTQGQDLLAFGNVVEGSQAAALAYVNPNGGGPSDVRCRILGNVCGGNTGGSHISGGIYCELDSGGTFTEFIICENVVNNPATTSPAQGIWTSFGVAGIIALNSVTSTDIGIENDNQHDMIVGLNRINAPIPFSGSSNALRSGNRLSTGATMGQVQLSSGTATVSTTEVLAGDNIILSRVHAGGTLGNLSVGTITAGTSFTVTSSSNTDTSTIYWKIDH